MKFGDHMEITTEKPTKLEMLWESLFDCGKSVGLCFNQEDASPCPHLEDDEPDHCCVHCEKRFTCAECCPLAKGE